MLSALHSSYTATPAKELTPLIPENACLYHDPVSLP